MVKITAVENGSEAEKYGIKPGDVLVSINGKEIDDVLDYRFYLDERIVKIECLRGNDRYETVIKKGEYDDIGLDFETPLMDKKQCCANKCIFCFIDQLPGGMRDTLYFKDDDRRLSFLHGNYITLTNLFEKDINKIIEMHLSPVKISVHTANPALRCKMMNNKRAGETLSYIGKLADAGIKIDAQIVLCRGVNDGAELDFTMKWLSEYYPAVESVSVVPAGLTKFRDGLYPLDPFTPGECESIISQINCFGSRFKEKSGSRLVFPADEFYVKAGIDLPVDGYYEDYAQIENGVGMIRSFETEFSSELGYIENCGRIKIKPRRISIATGVAAFDFINRLAKRLCNVFDGLRIDVYKIVNNYFGELITVSGLLTGRDIEQQLSGKELGECLYLPQNCLRAEKDLFLCGMTPEELSQKLGVCVKFAPENGDGWIYEISGTEPDGE